MEWRAYESCLALRGCVVTCVRGWCMRQLAPEDALNEATRGEQYFYVEVPNPDDVSQFLRLVHM